MNFQFQYKVFLWLLTAVVIFAVLFFLLLKWKRKTTIKIGDQRLVMQLIRNFSPRLFATKFILFSVAFALGVIAVANLRKPGSSDNITRKGIDVVVALDVSRSMLSTDLSPNRLERAKQMILKLMDQMPNDRVALVLFAGKAYMQMPLTVDHGAAALFVSTASPDEITAQGTVFSDALKMSARAFDPEDRRFKTVVLVSDGEDHDNETLKTAEDLAQQGVMVCTVGIGSAEGSQIPDSATNDYKRDAMGNIIVSRLNEEELRQIAQKTNGIYVHFESSEQTIDELMKQLSQVEKKSFTDVSLLNFKSYYTWFAGLMFLMLIIEFILPEVKTRRAS